MEYVQETFLVFSALKQRHPKLTQTVDPQLKAALYFALYASSVRTSLSLRVAHFVLLQQERRESRSFPTRRTRTAV
jgi:hypothetical protein